MHGWTFHHLSLPPSLFQHLSPQRMFIHYCADSPYGWLLSAKVECSVKVHVTGWCLWTLFTHQSEQTHICIPVSPCASVLLSLACAFVKQLTPVSLCSTLLPHAFSPLPYHSLIHPHGSDN